MLIPLDFGFSSFELDLIGPVFLLITPFGWVSYLQVYTLAYLCGFGTRGADSCATLLRICLEGL